MTIHPVPKPSRRSPPAQQKKNKKGVGRSRRDATQGTSLRRKSPMKKRRRSASEFKRIYGSKERVTWIAGQPCVACGRSPCDNAHVRGGGMARKESFTRIVPLCKMRMADGRPQSMGCHWTLHMMGRRMFETHYALDLDAEAHRIEAAWQAFQGGDE